nr:MAG: ORF2 protein [Wenzhou bat astrovirus 1]
MVIVTMEPRSQRPRASTPGPNVEVVVENVGRGRGNGRGRRGRSRSRGRSQVTFVQQSRSWQPSRSQSRSRRGRGGFRGRGRGVPPGARGKWHNYEAQIKDLKKKVDGPKEQDQFTLTVTAGIMQGNLKAGELLQREIGTWLNPLHLKDPTSGETPTPLSTRASQYALWKCKKLNVTLVPLAGSGVVVGSIGLVSLNQNSDAVPPSNLAAIQARPHVEVAIGARFQWRLQAKELEGPRQGWWLVDPGEEPTMSLGPQLEAWVYGHTINLFSYTPQQASNNQYGEGLWRVEFQVTYAFSNFQTKVGLSNMPAVVVSDAGSQSAAVFSRGPDGSLEVELNAPQLSENILACTRKFSNAEGRSLSDVILGITDTVAAAVGTIPGWGWLLSAGYQFVRGWFVKDGLGQPRLEHFYVYESLSAALDDRRVYVARDFPRTATVGPVEVQQLTNPNYGVPVGSYSASPGVLPARGVVYGDGCCLLGINLYVDGLSRMGLVSLD